MRLSLMWFVLQLMVFTVAMSVRGIGDFSPTVLAQEAATEKAPAAEAKAYTSAPADKLVALGPGVQKVEKNDNGSVKRLVTIDLPHC